MRVVSRAVLSVAAAAVLFSGAVQLNPEAANPAKPGVDWPQFRGIKAGGVAEGHTTPANWNIAEGKNVAWKTPLPGLGLSSPIVWRDQICLTTAISGHKDAGRAAPGPGRMRPLSYL